MAIALLGFVPAALAQEKKGEPPRVTAVTPLRVVAGEMQTVRLRGVKLKDATEIRSTPALSATIKEKKDAAVPNGSEAKDVGDQELVVELSVPADCKAETIALEVVTPTGTTSPRALAVGGKDGEVREKEPNNGFGEAQPWDGAKPLAGKIEGEKDVDVFRIDARAGQSLAIRVTAAGSGSLLDSTLALFNAAGQILASADDTAGARDARLSFTPKTDGSLCLVVSDAHDRGSAWHEYRIEREAQP